MLSPHVYGPMVTSAPTAWAGPDLYARLTASFGYATQQGQLMSGNVRRPYTVKVSTGCWCWQLRWN